MGYKGTTWSLQLQTLCQRYNSNARLQHTRAYDDGRLRQEVSVTYEDTPIYGYVQ